MENSLTFAKLIFCFATDGATVYNHCCSVAVAILQPSLILGLGNGITTTRNVEVGGRGSLEANRVTHSSSSLTSVKYLHEVTQEDKELLLIGGCRLYPDDFIRCVGPNADEGVLTRELSPGQETDEIVMAVGQGELHRVLWAITGDPLLINYL